MVFLRQPEASSLHFCPLLSHNAHGFVTGAVAVAVLAVVAEDVVVVEVVVVEVDVDVVVVVVGVVVVDVVVEAIEYTALSHASPFPIANPSRVVHGTAP